MAKKTHTKAGARRSAETIVVTGAGGLLGRRLTERLLQSGRDVVAIYRSRESDRPHITNAALHPLTLDLMKKGSITTLMATLAKMGCDITGVVHCARSRRNLAIDRLPTRDQWSNEFELGVSVAHELVYELAALPETKLKRVVLVGSMYGIVAVSPHLYPEGMTRPPLHYGITKAAMVHLTKELAVPLAARGINVNSVSIGGIEGRTSAAFKRRYRQLCPQGRMLNVDEAAAPIEFLLSDAAGGIVGHNLVVDGGWSIW